MNTKTSMRRGLRSHPSFLLSTCINLDHSYWHHIVWLFMLFLTSVPHVSAQGNVTPNVTSANRTDSNSTNSTGGSKTNNPFISEIAGPLLLVTTILFFLSILYVLVCLCLIRCGSVRFDPVHYPDGRIYFCLGVRFLSSWCYLPLCGGGATSPTSQRGGNNNTTENDLRSYPPPPPWLAGDHNELISSMDDFGIYIPIFDRAGRKKALEALLDHSNMFYGDPNNPTGGGGEVRTMVMRRLSASQENLDASEELDPERMISVGRMICSHPRELNTTGSGNVTKTQSFLESDLGIMPLPQDRPVDGSSSFVRKTSFQDALNSDQNSPNVNLNANDKSDPIVHNEQYPRDSNNDPLEEYAMTSCLDSRSMTCPICLEDLDNSTAVIVSNPTVCNHTFHRDCLVEWLSNNHASCPCCRMDWVSNVMLWDALRWVILKEQEDERERRKEEKRLRRLQRRQSRRCIRESLFCCSWCSGGHPSITPQDANVIQPIGVSSSAPERDEQEQYPEIDEEIGSTYPIQELQESNPTDISNTYTMAVEENLQLVQEPADGNEERILPRNNELLLESQPEEIHLLTSSESIEIDSNLQGIREPTDNANDKV